MHRYRIFFAKQGDLKYISHLDLQRTVIRAMNRADLPVAYSQGFNPQPKLTFAAPLAVGIEGKNELMELDLTEHLPPGELGTKLQNQFPAGLEIKFVEEKDPAGPSLASQVTGAVYRVFLAKPLHDLEKRIKKLKNRSSIVVSRPGKKGEKKIDLKPFILDLSLDQGEQGQNVITMQLVTGNQGGARPGEILQQLGVSELEPPPSIYRTELLLEQ